MNLIHVIISWMGGGGGGSESYKSDETDHAGYANVVSVLAHRLRRWPSIKSISECDNLEIKNDYADSSSTDSA